MNPDKYVLTIIFDDGMPAASVEVIAPDFSVVRRMIMREGQTQEVSVPSSMVVLRLSLPSGRTITLPEKGTFVRSVSVDSLNIPLFEREKLTTRKYFRDVAVNVGEGSGFVSEDVAKKHWYISLVDRGRQPLRGEFFYKKDKWSWKVPTDYIDAPPAMLEIGVGKKMLLNVSVPSHTRTLDVKHWMSSEGEIYRIRLTTSVESADILLSFLSRGNLAAASAMSSWASGCEALLMQKGSDPAGAAVGGYLLLKMGKFTQLRDWPKNLAGDPEDLRSTDGAIIWASQLVAMGRRDELGDIKRYLFAAADNSLPVYTEGLRLLIEGLRLLGSEAETRLNALIDRIGIVVWDSPLTAYLTSSSPARNNKNNPVIVDVGFAEE